MIVHEAAPVSNTWRPSSLILITLVRLLRQTHVTGVATTSFGVNNHNVEQQLRIYNNGINNPIDHNSSIARQYHLDAALLVFIGLEHF